MREREEGRGGKAAPSLRQKKRRKQRRENTHCCLLQSSSHIEIPIAFHCTYYNIRTVRKCRVHYQLCKRTREGTEFRGEESTARSSIVFNACLKRNSCEEGAGRRASRINICEMFVRARWIFGGATVRGRATGSARAPA